MNHPLPETGPDRQFQSHVADGHLWIQHCSDCGGAIFHPRVLCPHCGSLALEWRRASGRGTVYSRADLIQKPKPGETEPRHHALVLVDLDEGPRMMSRLPDVAPEEIRIGMRVQARIAGDPGEYAVVFDPEEAAE
ncbi:Zn-ribbon domain-containing OB-fold protein [Tropicimonas sp. IMCC34043]|uniref:Zn-ribbon domain-containing OB-fold protein n=1 Tax=Tropicimonas sp. IMCC34043 TaxID=2248760 RepID=UPI000E24DC90|nr:OB-fold domain-containing protein [Tropicimonas sp. IMCC34043]